MYTNKILDGVSKGGKSVYFDKSYFSLRVANHPANEKFFENESDENFVLSIVLGTETKDSQNPSEKFVTSEDEAKDLIWGLLHESYEATKDIIDVAIYEHLDWEEVANKFELVFFSEEEAV